MPRDSEGWISSDGLLPVQEIRGHRQPFAQCSDYVQEPILHASTLEAFPHPVSVKIVTLLALTGLVLGVLLWRVFRQREEPLSTERLYKGFS
jgi:hypothetical protein